MRAFILSGLFILTLLLPAHAAEAASFHVQEVKSKSGLKAWLVEDQSLPFAQITLLWRGAGVEQDPPEKQGRALLLASLLNEGAGPYNARAFQELLANKALTLSFDATRDAFKGTLRFLREDKDLAVRLMHLALTEPRFEDEAIKRMKNELGVLRAQQYTSPNWQARYALYARLFEGHPYGMRSLGTDETMASVQKKDLRQFLHEALARDNLIIGAAGAITPQELAKALDDLFEGLPEKAKLKTIEPFSFPLTPFYVTVARPGTQTDFFFVTQGPAREDPDWAAAEIANYLMGGGGFESRLMKALRTENGLTYGVSTNLAPMAATSFVVGSMAVANEKASEAFDALRATWRRFTQEGPTDEELTKAKTYLRGALPLALTSVDDLAEGLAGFQFDDLGKDCLQTHAKELQSVTRADVKRALQRFFNPDLLFFTAVGQPKGLAFAGPVPLTLH